MKRRNPSPELAVGLLQHDCTEDLERNTRLALAAAEAAAKAGAQIICTQELFRSRYFCQVEDHRNFALAEPVPGPTTEVFGRFARKHRVVVIVSLFENRAPGVYHNTAAVLDADGALLGWYRKMHIPDDPLYYEKFYFTPGDKGFRVWTTRFGKIAVLICWDQWFPEAARLAVMQGARIIFYPTAIGWHPAEKAALGAQQHSAWETVQRGHAIANGVYLAAVNRVGLEQAPGGSGLEFWGQSFVADPMGQVLARASSDKAENLVVSVDMDYVDVVRTHWPFLRDRRIDAYGDITRRMAD